MICKIQVVIIGEDSREETRTLGRHRNQEIAASPQP
jgi:hypothetical protein